MGLFILQCVCALMELVFWKLDSVISSRFSGERQLQRWGMERKWINGRNPERVEESSANVNVVSFNVQQEIALYWRVTDTGAMTTRLGWIDVFFVLFWKDPAKGLGKRKKKA